MYISIETSQHSPHWLCMKSASAIDKIDNPNLDPALLRATKDFLVQRFPQMIDGNAEDFFNFVVAA